MRHLLTLLLLLGLLTLSAQQRRGSDYAYFFAVDDYGARADWNDLRNPVRDARALAKELEEMYGFQTKVFDNPDQATIDREIRKLRNRTFGPDDQLLIFFSGHGDYDDYRQRGYFLPAGSGEKFSLLDMRDVIGPVACDHLLLVVDACYSGTIDEEIALKGRGQRPGVTAATARQDLIDRKLRNRSRLLLTSGGKQRTPDGVDGSPFTIGLLTALRRGYGMGDGIVTYEDVLATLERVSPTPHNGELPGHEQGSFVFVSTSTSVAMGGTTPTTTGRPTTPPSGGTPTNRRITPARDAEVKEILRNARTLGDTPPVNSVARVAPGTEGLAPNVAEVITDVLRVSGGLLAWRQVTSLQLTQQFQFSNGLTGLQSAYLTADGKRAFYQTDNYGNQLKMTYDGRRGQIIDPYQGNGQIQPLPEQSRKNLTNVPVPDVFVDPTKRGYTVTRMPDQFVNGVNYRILNFRHANGFNANYWFNANNHVLEGQEYTDPTTGLVNTTIMGGHRLYNGILLPTIATTTYGGGGGTMVATVTQQYVNQPIDPGLFSLD